MNLEQKESLASLQELQEIKRMMQQSSRFVSLSGLSGIAVGTCALVASYFGLQIINHSTSSPIREISYNLVENPLNIKAYMGYSLFRLAVVTLVVSVTLAFIFTYIKSKKANTPIWGITAKRLTVNVAIPLMVGGIFILKLIEYKCVGLVAPACLIFYGLALVNGSKYTLGEVRYLGYGQLLLGIINSFFIGYGIYFWAIGFGILHIIYGVYMWYQYERGQ
jgi:hypothetical protein